MRLLLLASLLALPASAQEADTLVWETDLTGKLSASQAGYQNWAKGGVNTLAFLTALDGAANRTGLRWEQNHSSRLAFGIVRQEGEDFRKSDDLIRFASALQYQGEGFFALFNPTIAAEFNTQFAEGFNFKDNPFPDSTEVPVKVSAFLAPAFFTQSIGLTYDPEEWITTRLGIGAKETIVTVERFRPLYGVPVDQLVQWDVGLESRTEFDREVFENVRLQSVLSAFAAFNRPELPDVMWENNVVMKVNDWLNVNFEVVTLFDRDIDKRAQLKEVLAVGISFVLI